VSVETADSRPGAKAFAPCSDRVETVRSWLLARKPDYRELPLDFDLIENRVIDSLLFLEFVFFLEELTGREIQVTPELVESFRTLRSIEENLIHGNAQPQ
jgi:acyl carrier protein